jgi:gas vesicle protein
MKEEAVMNKDFAKGLCIGLVSGAVIGGVMALLYAPKTGKETRQLIKDKAIDVVDIAREKAGEVIDMVKDGASEASRKGQAAIHALKS